mgnify:CR=1 FL=1
MKKTIYKYLFKEFIIYFTVTLFALAAIVWTIQAVNYLDLITDDGHAFATYFAYSFFSLSKVLTKLIPFCFLLALILTITKLEKDNELIVLWTSGLNKINIVNLILRISVTIMLFQLLLTIFFNPTLLNYSRTLLKDSQLQFVPSLLKKKQFNDAVEGLTIFVGDKNKNKIYTNIFIRDEGSILSNLAKKDSLERSSTIIAKTGRISEDENSLILYNGNIQKSNEDGEISIIRFDKTVLSLSGITAQSISEPKMQETSTIQILNCLQKKTNAIHNCNNTKKSLMDNKIEINKRFGMPIYIPFISLICCFLLASRRDKKMFSYNKYIYFFIGFVILILAEVIVRYSGTSWNHTFFYYLIPLGLTPLFYLILIRAFKYENLS